MQELWRTRNMRTMDFFSVLANPKSFKILRFLINFISTKNYTFSSACAFFLPSCHNNTKTLPTSCFFQPCNTFFLVNTPKQARWKVSLLHEVWDLFMFILTYVEEKQISLFHKKLISLFHTFSETIFFSLKKYLHETELNSIFYYYLQL